jgi:hypothetical protein
MYIKLHCAIRSRPRRPNNSFGVDQKLKMAISHGSSWHCSFMGNSLSSLGEALKTMNAIKFGRYVICQIMHKWYNSVTNVYTDLAAKASIEISDNFSWTACPTIFLSRSQYELSRMFSVFSFVKFLSCMDNDTSYQTACCGVIDNVAILHWLNIISYAHHHDMFVN